MFNQNISIKIQEYHLQFLPTEENCEGSVYLHNKLNKQ